MRIILNADDFGKSPGRNIAIVDSFKQGMIFSCGMIVTGKYLRHAVELMNAAPEVSWADVHLHVNLSANLFREGSEDAPLSEVMRRDPFFCKSGKFKFYHGLPNRPWTVIKWKTVYNEMVAQFESFKEITGGQADYSHIDFHLWYNLTWPVAVALGRFTKKYHIRSVRYIGEHQRGRRLFRLMLRLSRDPQVLSVPATNIDYFLSNQSAFSRTDLVELYCHPHYKEDGILLDDSPSYLKHERLPMACQTKMLRESGNYEYVSWKDVVFGR